MTNWIYGPRCSGKTTRLIELAEKHDAYIVVSSERRRLQLLNTARRMGKDIRNPITLQELPFHMTGNPYLMTHHGVLVDDTADILERIIGARVMYAVANTHEEPCRNADEWFPKLIEFGSDEFPDEALKRANPALR